MSAWGNAGNALGTHTNYTRILHTHITHAHFAPHDPRKHASHLQARRVGPMSAWGNALGTHTNYTRILHTHITHAHFAPHDPRKYASHLQAAGSVLCQPGATPATPQGRTQLTHAYYNRTLQPHISRRMIRANTHHIFRPAGSVLCQTEDSPITGSGTWMFRSEFGAKNFGLWIK